jgi:hypothetical protein
MDCNSHFIREYSVSLVRLACTCLAPRHVRSPCDEAANGPPLRIAARSPTCFVTTLFFWSPTQDVNDECVAALEASGKRTSPHVPAFSLVV